MSPLLVAFTLLHTFILKLKDYIKALQVIAKDKGNADLRLVYACDDEGNDYHEVFYAPSVAEGKDAGYPNDEKVIYIN